MPKKIITFLSKFHRLDGEYVVFGKVIDGMDTVYAIEGGAGTYSGKPRKKVIIVDSGEIPRANGKKIIEFQQLDDRNNSIQV